MKGIVFTEFIEIVESMYGLEVVDEVISSSNLKSKGVFTAVGTYSHKELIIMVRNLSKMIDVEVPELLNIYGKYLFHVFVKKYSSLFVGYDNTLDFLEHVDGHIHVEVTKLYPDAELPKLTFEKIKKNKGLLVYESSRRLSDFGEGLILGSAEHFNEKLSIAKRDLSNNEGTKIEFEITIIE